MPISQTTGLESSIWGDQHKLSPSVSLTLGSYPIILNCSGLNLQYYPKSERVQKNDTIFKIQKQDNQIDSSHTLSAFLGKKQNSRSLQALCTPYTALCCSHPISTVLVPPLEHRLRWVRLVSIICFIGFTFTRDAVLPQKIFHRKDLDIRGLEVMENGGPLDGK